MLNRVSYSYWRHHIIGSVNGLMPSDKTPLPELMWTKTHATIFEVYCVTGSMVHDIVSNSFKHRKEETFDTHHAMLKKNPSGLMNTQNIYISYHFWLTFRLVMMRNNTSRCTTSEYKERAACHNECNVQVVCGLCPLSFKPSLFCLWRNEIWTQCVLGNHIKNNVAIAHYDYANFGFTSPIFELFSTDC